jgi:hypothetical protein
MNSKNKKVINKIVTFPTQIDQKENFETLIDLFTLLSFALILSAIFWGVMNSQNDKIAKISLYEVGQQNQGFSNKLPEGTILLLITKENSKDLILIIESEDFPKEIYNSENKMSINEALSTFIDKLQYAKDVQIIFDESKKANPFLLYSLEKWFAKQTKEVKINFYEG